MTKIRICKSPTADTRSCDPSTVIKSQLKESSRMHIDDVRKGLKFFADMLKDSGSRHDVDKLSDIDGFYCDFAADNIMKGKWYVRHLKVNRHHIDRPAGVPDDVNLIDVLDHVADCVMAGKARTGKVFDVVVPDKVLRKAVKNTVDLLIKNVSVAD